MINRGNFLTEDQLDYSKYFPHFNNGFLVSFAILIFIIVGISVVILIRKRLMTKKIKILILLITFIFGGFILCGFPNIIFLTGLTFLILGLTLIFGRIFCGYICPLGAMQELASMMRFKSSLNLNKCK